MNNNLSKRSISKSIFVVIAGVLVAGLYQSSDARTWTDKSGKFKLDAEFESYADGSVHLKKPDGSTIKVPFLKLSTEDQRFVRQKIAEKKKTAAGAEPTKSTGSARSKAAAPRLDPAPNVTLRYDDGTIELPGGSTLQLEILISHPAAPNGYTAPGVPAFAVELEGQDRLAVVTALSYFTSGPLQLAAEDLGKRIQKITVIDGVMGREVGKGEGILNIPKATGEEWDFSGDVFAVWVKKSPAIAPLKLADEDAKIGEKGFLLRFPEWMVGEALRAKRQPELLPFDMRSVQPVRQTFLLTQGSYPQLSGTPMINKAGEVIGIHVGRAQHANGQILGMGNPATAIRKQLAAATQNADRPE